MSVSESMQPVCDTLFLTFIPRRSFCILSRQTYSVNGRINGKSFIVFITTEDEYKIETCHACNFRFYLSNGLMNYGC